MTATYGELRTNGQKQIDAELKERVERGIALLQEKHGDAWVEMINMKTLALDEVNRCVLGQVYGDYGRGVAELFDGSVVKATEYGFDLADDWSDDYDPAKDFHFNDLQEAWEFYLSRILEPDKP